MSENKFTKEDIFNKWMGFLRENQEIRYLHSERPALVEDLAVMLKDHGVDYDEAKGYKKSVVKALTTEEGRKGKGRYKGWVETVEQDFLFGLANVYIDDPEKTSKKRVKEVKKGNYISKNKIITAWGIHRYGELWTEKMDDEAHRVNSRLNMRFQNEVFYSENPSDFNDFPLWLKKVCNF